MNKRRSGKLCALALALSLLLPGHPARAAETSGQCGADIAWTLDSGGTLTLDGSGETDTYSGNNTPPWYEVRNQILHVKVQGGITALNGSLFSGCGSLTDITLCASLERLTIEDSYGRWPETVASVTVEKRTDRATADGETDGTAGGGTGETDGTAGGGTGATDGTAGGGTGEIGGTAGNESGETGGTGKNGENSGNGGNGGSGGGQDDGDSGNYVSHEGVLYAKAATGKEYALSDGSDGTAGKFALLFYPPAKPDAAYTLLDGTEAAADGAFYRAAYLERLELDGGLRRIPKLYYCKALKEIAIPSGAREFPASAFEGCASLEEVKLPSGLTEIPSMAFYGCSALKALEIPNTVTTVNTTAFWLCDALQSITIPASVHTVIGSGSLPVTGSPDLSRYKEWVFQGDVPEFRNWTGGVMARTDGSMAAVGDRIMYPAGGVGWSAYIWEYRENSHEPEGKTIFQEYGAQPQRRSKTWLNGDGSVLDMVSWTDGETVPGETKKIPTKAPAGGYEYAFDHWEADSATETDTIYYPSFTSVQTDPHYGQRRVIYRASVGGEMETEYFAAGTEITLRENVFDAPEGKVFHCWKIWSAEYQPGDAYTVTEDVYVTAHWEDAPEEEPGTDPQSGTDPESGTDPQSGTDPESGTDPQSGTNPQSGTTPEPGALPQSGTNPQSGTTPEPGALPQPEQAGCYVATAVYGSYDCPEVWTLRRYRDQVLGESWYGRLFIRCYYAASPAAVRLFGGADWFRDFFRTRLDRMVEQLQEDGFASAPYEDTAW